MFIIPLETRINWRKPPVATFLLIFLNCVIYLGYQTFDDERRMRASEIYMKGEIIELELPLVEEFVKTLPAEEVIGVDTSSDWFVEKTIFSPQFDEFLRNYWQENPDKVENDWRNAREEFEEARGKISIFRYGYTPAIQDPITFLTSMFMHGGLDHLFGNMLFLFIFGFSLEVMIGRLRFLLLYLLTGLCATAMHTAFNMGDYTPCVGASGAISGLMGMYLAAYGLQRIRFFYFVFFYFGEFTAPAVVLFPFWIGKEIYEQYTAVSNVAYMAHAGGMLGGFLMVLILKFAGMLKVDVNYQDEEVNKAEKEEIDTILAKANDQFAKMNVEQARLTCKRGVEKFPLSAALWEKYFSLWKTEPGNRGIHEVAFEIFKMAKLKETNIEFVEKVMDEYLGLVKKPAALNGPVSLMLAKRFKREGNQKKVAWLVDHLLVQNIKDDSMPQLMNYLILNLEKANEREKAFRYKHIIEEVYPGSLI